MWDGTNPEEKSTLTKIIYIIMMENQPVKIIFLQTFWSSPGSKEQPWWEKAFPTIPMCLRVKLPAGRAPTSYPK
jgi:hypothetical protein